MVVKILFILSILTGSSLALHLSNDRTADSSSGGSVLIPPIMTSVSGTLQQHVNNPYRRMAAAAESERQRMIFMGGGRRGRPIVTGRLHLTTDNAPDVNVPNYQASSVTMLQENEFPVRREPFFFVGDDDDGLEGVDRGGGGVQNFARPSNDHYHRYEDGSYEVMEDIFNRGEDIYRKFTPMHHQPPPLINFAAKPPPAKGLQDLFDHRGISEEIDVPQHRSGNRDLRIKQRTQRKRTQSKQSSENQHPLLDVKATEPSLSPIIALANTVSPSSTLEKPEAKLQKQNQKQQQLPHRTTNIKRSGINSGIGAPPPVTHTIASQLMLRTARGQRQYDVPQIECPSAIDGMERFACPTPDLQGRYRCIDDHVLCDGFIDCPEGEDEDRRSCMFYKTTKAHLDVLADALLRWARGR